MKIARILYPVTVLGPGKRIGIWVAGCSKKCKGCANPELWDKDKYPDMDIEDLKDIIQRLYEKINGQVDGITISGGEPFEQAEELLQLVQFLHKKTEDILIFSGKKIEELIQEKNATEIIDKITVLVDGEYIEDENFGEVLRGSKNQRIHVLKESFKEQYLNYQKKNEGKQLVENFQVRDGVVAVGIHKRDFDKRLLEVLEEKDIVRKTVG